MEDFNLPKHLVKDIKDILVNVQYQVKREKDLFNLFQQNRDPRQNSV